MNKKQLLVSILIPNVVGLISALLSNISNNINTFTKPSFNPPGIVFPIVWTILYILMGISSYIVYRSNDTYKDKALIIYGIQLIINGLWSIIFFRFKLFFLAFITIVILAILTAIMIYKFYQINKTAGLLQIPYLIWLIFASVLSYGVFLLN